MELSASLYRWFSHHLPWQFKPCHHLRYFNFLPVASQTYDSLRTNVHHILVQHAGMWWNKKGFRCCCIIWNARSSERNSISWHARKGILQKIRQIAHFCVCNPNIWIPWRRSPLCPLFQDHSSSDSHAEDSYTDFVLTCSSDIAGITSLNSFFLNVNYQMVVQVHSELPSLPDEFAEKTPICATQSSP